MGSLKSRVFYLGWVLIITHVAVGQIAVTTYHNDSARTGLNAQEAVLTPSNVNSSSFGMLCTYSLPDNSYAYAQPLYMPNVSIGGQLRNVVYVATEQDIVYAFDADCNSTSALWQKSLGTPISSFPYANFLSPTIGVTGTPVIDDASNTLYVVA